MNMPEIIIAIILFLISAGSFTMSCFSFKEKGFLFNNAYIFASKKERNSMNKKPYYRQSAIVWFSVGIIFLLNVIQIIFSSDWLFYVVLAIAIATIIYAVASSARIERKK